MVPFTAPAGVNFIAGSTYHGGQMPHFTLPPPPCQQIPEASSSCVESVSRSHSAPQLGKQRKRKGAIDWCNSSTMQTCPLHKAQANFRKSLRRGFLSPLAAQGTSEEHFSPCKARGGHPASPQVTPCAVLRCTSCFLKMLRTPYQSSVSLQFCQARFIACNGCPSSLQLLINCRQRTHGRQVMWRCKPL